MASTFRPVNPPMPIKVEPRDGGAASPTTPTPTKVTFGQRPLPTEPFPQAVQIPESIEEDKISQRDNSQRSQTSRGHSEDIHMDDADGEAHGNDDMAVAMSDGESVNADNSKLSKKKKSQQFYCTDFPPCNLSFTRSEHLARHIRKHTGERPFQCHCSRRFSRLDNLRQHAQTVHVNEDIPMDSLAASGTRFQRQMRPDRPRQTGRARASTATTIVGPARGHSKSLSTSSLSSVGSNFSARDDIRRRPPPLVMADPRFQHPTDVYPRPPPSPSDFSTPTSATFSTGQNSPHWGSVMASPNSHSRSHSLYAGSQVPTRRLSVPSSGAPFPLHQGMGLGRPVYGHGSPGIAVGSHPSFSPASTALASPTSVISRRESTAGAEDWRRRTWHPDSTFNTNPPSSRLSHVFTPSQYPTPPQRYTQPAVPREGSRGPVRLPGIESFAFLPHRPASPRRQSNSTVAVEPDHTRPPTLLPTANAAESEETRSPTNWAMGLHKGLTRLDITSDPAASDGAGTWAHEAKQAMDAQADRLRSNPPTVRFHESVIGEQPTKPTGPLVFHQYTMSAPSIASSRDGKRRGWNAGGAPTYAEARPEKIARVDRMVHPNIREFSGFPAREATSGPAPRNENSNEKGMVRLETLVAVATGEGKPTEAY
ncbi:putative nutrient and stress factor 1 [Rosellinia necatrix]|uniref:Putative nutrient and stress factor 1 n=1 Tax=Rosellinia necatrix TaxID=77044 RepID=A0A1W2TQB9_ROSNE|nr:putative nutrient and stress factor 1 [Rosellinia necatrix]